MPVNKINIGIIGYGTVGSGVVKILTSKKKIFKEKFNAEFNIKTICDLYINQRDTKNLKSIALTTDANKILNDGSIDVVVELIGGLKPAKDFVVKALSSGKHVVTANKALISNFGKELFELAQKNNCYLFFESAVLAGVPIIKTISEGVAGNNFNQVYGIVNGTCNFILTEMMQKNISFNDALAKAQKNGYAEADPTLDINGKDSAHKLVILIYLAFGRFVKVQDIYTEGIEKISSDDIEHAESLNLSIKLLAIAKRKGNKIEARVNPTFISKDHPLASINNVVNAVYFNADLLGNVLLSGEGAGQLAAASGVVSDLINLTTKKENSPLICNNFNEDTKIELEKIDNIKTKFYIRFMAIDKPGVLATITGILGKYKIGINTVNQKQHNPAATVPVVMLTDYVEEKMLRQALKEIEKLSVVKQQPVAIRMENLD